MMLGRPGSGKSYEAVVYHLLPALRAGRKVVTNLPVMTDLIYAIDPGYADLLEFRKSKGRWLGSHVDDYGDDWRDAKGKGPLYIIDECHKSLRRGKMSDDIEEWYAESRHEGADVLLITQFHSKVSREILEHVDIVYRVANNRALGHDKSYIRKVLNGVRGTVLNETIRTYDPQYFKFYRSHTKSDKAIQEAMAQDIKPIWRHWSFMGAMLLLPLGLIGMLIAGSPFSTGQDVPPVKPESPPVDAAVRAPSERPLHRPEPQSVNHPPVPSRPQPEPDPDPEPEPEPDHPYSKVRLHVSGWLGASGRDLYVVTASQNGQPVFTLTTDDLLRAGYTLSPRGPCLLTVTFNDYRDNLVCDLPSVSPVAHF